MAAVTLAPSLSIFCFWHHNFRVFGFAMIDFINIRFFSVRCSECYVFQCSIFGYRDLHHVQNVPTVESSARVRSSGKRCASCLPESIQIAEMSQDSSGDELSQASLRVSLSMPSSEVAAAFAQPLLEVPSCCLVFKFPRPDMTKHQDIAWYLEPLADVVCSWTMTVPPDLLKLRFRDLFTGSNPIHIVTDVFIRSNMGFLTV